EHLGHVPPEPEQGGDPGPHGATDRAEHQHEDDADRSRPADQEAEVRAERGPDRPLALLAVADAPRLGREAGAERHEEEWRRDAQRLTPPAGLAEAAVDQCVEHRPPVAAGRLDEHTRQDQRGEHAEPVEHEPFGEPAAVRATTSTWATR